MLMTNKKPIKIALVGDYQASVAAHQAIPKAIRLAADALALQAEFDWVSSTDVSDSLLKHYSGLWCVPASPYQHTDNVLSAIAYARQHDLPFLGTCGGYQHAALEYARGELGYSSADNAEINPDTSMPLIAGLSCKLYDESAAINLVAGSKIAKIYSASTVSEEYFCGYGVNRKYLPIFNGSGMVFSGFDVDGDPRSLEIPLHTFFIGTAFQPERSAFTGAVHPLIAAFLASQEQSH